MLVHHFEGLLFIEEILANRVQTTVLKPLFRFLIAILVVFLTIIPVGLVRAESVAYSVNPDNINVTMELLLRENLTALPSFNIKLDQSNSTMLTQPMTLAITKNVPKASVTNLQFAAKTQNVSSTWTLTEDYSFVVIGANERLGSIVNSHLAFASLNLSQSIKIAGYELDAVGQDYLLGPLNAQPQSQTSYFIDGAPARTPLIPAETTKRFWLLDFTWVPGLNAWKTQNDLLNQQTTWTFSPLLPPYNLTLGRISPEGTLLTAFVAIYKPSMIVTVHANARTSGSSLSFELPTPLEIVMPAVILVSLIALITALIVDRRITRSIRGRPRKRS